MSVDHEARLSYDPGDIYEVLPGFGATRVIDDVAHLGLSDDTDVDAFELVWLRHPQGTDKVLAILFSVDDDDPLTRNEDESGGLNPKMIYGSFLTGNHFPLLNMPLDDDVDGLTNWHSLLGCIDCGDYNGDGIVDFIDYIDFADDWDWIGPVACYNHSDQNCDRRVDWMDLRKFAEKWLNSCP